MSDLFSPMHPHEPEIPALVDVDGRCFSCILITRAEGAESEVERLTAERDESLAILRRIDARLKRIAGALLDPEGTP